MKAKAYFQFGLVALLLIPAQQVSAQTSQSQTPPAQPAQPIQKRRPTAVVPSRPVIVENVPNAHQVVTLLHRLSGLKMFRLLVRSGEARAIERWDKAFKIDGQVHTNVIAGLALDDGVTVAAWLPDVGAEVGPPLPPEAPKAPEPGETPNVSPRTYTPVSRRYGLYEKPNVTVVAQDHKRAAAKYVGLDGVTGLSILKLTETGSNSATPGNDAREDSIIVGQRVHLFAPEPVADKLTAKGGAIYARIGETEARITKLMRAPGGGIARVQIKSPKLSPANIGGVVLNEAGETVGIIDTVKASEATVLPATSVRSAAKRVLARQASVPRPWLGISGEPIQNLSVERLLLNGWQTDVANTLAQQQLGILLTSVMPGSPASNAALRPGDVILSVNDGVVRSAQDFSWILEEAGAGDSLRFTVARPGKMDTHAVDVKLTEAPDPFFGLRSKFSNSFYNNTVTNFGAGHSLISNSLLESGLETITLLPKIASQLGSDGGLLVVYVEPATAAFKAGLRPGDVIESINGQNINRGEIKLNQSVTNYSCVVVRNKQKLVLTFDHKEN